jgi:hypothetical protein
LCIFQGTAKVNTASEAGVHTKTEIAKCHAFQRTCLRA